jgi:hypothetical protein
LFPAWLAGGAATTLTGDFGGPDQIKLYSVTKADWEANDYRLVKDYVIDSADSVGIALTDANLDADCDPGAPVVACKQVFVAVPIPALGGSIAFRISDPNISFVNLNGGNLEIGLSAALDSTAFLQPLLDIFAPGVTLTPPNVASEVVIYEWQGQRQAFYGFDCVDSRQDAGDGPIHATNSYSCTVPEPGTVALLALGLVGAGWAPRRGKAPPFNRLFMLRRADRSGYYAGSIRLGILH